MLYTISHWILETSVTSPSEGNALRAANFVFRAIEQAMNETDFPAGSEQHDQVFRIVNTIVFNSTGESHEVAGMAASTAAKAMQRVAEEITKFTLGDFDKNRVFRLAHDSIRLSITRNSAELAEETAISAIRAMIELLITIDFTACQCMEGHP